MCCGENGRRKVWWDDEVYVVLAIGSKRKKSGISESVGTSANQWDLHRNGEVADVRPRAPFHCADFALERPSLDLLPNNDLP